MVISDDEGDEDLDDLYALPNKKPAPHSPKGKKAAVSTSDRISLSSKIPG